MMFINADRLSGLATLKHLEQLLPGLSRPTCVIHANQFFGMEGMGGN